MIRKSMSEEEWSACAYPDRMLVYLRVKAVATSRRLRLFNCACCRKVWDVIPEEVPRRFVESVEQLSDGVSSKHHDQLSRELTEIYSSNERSRSWRDKTPADWGTHIAFWCTAENPTRIIDYVAGVPVTIALCLAHQKIGKQYGRDRDEQLTEEVCAKERPKVATILRDLIPKPLVRKRVRGNVSWLTSNVTALAQAIYDERAFDRLPILADALEEAGCTNADVLSHCRQPGEHVRGCWVVDLVLGKT